MEKITNKKNTILKILLGEVYTVVIMSLSWFSGIGLDADVSILLQMTIFRANLAGI